MRMWKLIEKARQCTRKSAIAFLNLEKAYDRDDNNLWVVLRMYGVNSKLNRFYSDNKACVRVKSILI